MRQKTKKGRQETGDSQKGTEIGSCFSSICRLLPATCSIYITMLAFLGLLGLPSCWGWEEPQQETKKAISTLEEEEMAPDVGAGFKPAPTRQREEDYEELKDVMASASRSMKRLEGALEVANWPSTRDSAKRLEDLIGSQCINFYIKAHKDVSQDFVQISQRFNDTVLRLLVAQQHQDVPLARSQFQLMQEGCEECHKKYRKERSVPGG
jgi:hypothetical protein